MARRPIMTVAIPIFGSRVSPRFDCAPSMLLATVEEGRVVRRETVSTADRNPLARIGWLCQQQAGVVICGGISGFSIRLLTDRGIQVFPWVWGAVDDALQMFVSGRLESGLIIEPGGRGRRCRRRGRRWHSDGSGDRPQRS
jgi:predicted Fe-Mo cluster-binding NifX family protein